MISRLLDKNPANRPTSKEVLLLIPKKAKVTNSGVFHQASFSDINQKRGSISRDNSTNSNVGQTSRHMRHNMSSEPNTLGFEKKNPKGNATDKKEDHTHKKVSNLPTAESTAQEIKK